MIKLLLILLAFAVIGEVGASDRINDIYAVTDSDISNFLGEFITTSVKTVTDLVNFVVLLLKGSIASDIRLPSIPKY